MGMFVVNCLGGFVAVPAVLRHHNTYCSYADVIMPQFFFAVGFALRLVLLREIEQHGRKQAYLRGLRRGLSLILFGLLFYQLDGQYKTWAELKELGVLGFFQESFRRSGFQALTHIGVTSLWVLPIITLSGRWRLLFALFATGLHLWLSHLFWYEALHEWHVIDGGLLGFLTWTIPTIAGSFAYDWVKASPHNALRPLAIWGGALMLVGYGLSCLSQGGQLAALPFTPPNTEVDLWTMSQRAGSASYLSFAAGVSLAVYAIFVWCCDLKGRASSIFATLGANAFAAYVIHLVALSCFGPFGPKDAPLWYAIAFMATGSFLAYRITKWCNDRNLYLRL